MALMNERLSGGQLRCQFQEACGQTLNQQVTYTERFQKQQLTKLQPNLSCL